MTTGVVGKQGDATGRGEPNAPSVPGGTRGFGRWARGRRSWVPVVVGLLVVAFGAGAAWYHSQADPSGPTGTPVVVTVANGESTSAVVATMASDGIIGSPLAFRIWSTIHTTPIIQPGGYQLHHHSSFSSAMATLGNGPDVYSVTVPPGFTFAETASRLGYLPGRDAASFLSLVASGTVRSPWEPAGSDNIDGLLAPGTYTVLPGESDEQILDDMVSAFDRTASSVNLTGAAAVLGITPYQALIVASIVEKEGVFPANEGKVARVIYNRLAAGMELDMDSTVLYAEGKDGGQGNQNLQSPYNTYLNRGLTPTPTCFPSMAALQAALSPTPGSWLYFVVVESNGTEAFADTFAEQQANEALAAQRGVG